MIRYEKRWTMVDLRSMSKEEWQTMAAAVQDLGEDWAWGPSGLDLREGVPGACTFHQAQRTDEYVLTWWEDDDATRVYRKARGRGSTDLVRGVRVDSGPVRVLDPPRREGVLQKVRRFLGRVISK